MSDRDNDAFVTTHRTAADEVTTVIVTDHGATAHPCPGGLTEDDLVN